MKLEKLGNDPQQRIKDLNNTLRKRKLNVAPERIIPIIDSDDQYLIDGEQLRREID